MLSASRLRLAAIWSTVAAWLVLGYLAWFVAPDWSNAPDVSAPLTRKLLFYHPASAWASFLAYTLVFAASIVYLRERDLRRDTFARSAAEVGFLFNTIALATGTAWGWAEWQRAGQNAIATIYTDPKVVVVLIMWFVFAAYLMLRRLVDEPERRARLAAVFGILGFTCAPLSFLASRVLASSLHPDVAGPGANADAAVGAQVGMIIGFSMIAYTLLFLALFLQRLRLARLEERIELLEVS
ncbi:MAG: cytochrome c biogenesis protein CcsA [Candidatus Thermoplasmatota archaeon]